MVFRQNYSPDMYRGNRITFRLRGDACKSISTLPHRTRTYWYRRSNCRPSMVSNIACVMRIGISEAPTGFNIIARHFSSEILAGRCAITTCIVSALGKGEKTGVIGFSSLIVEGDWQNAKAGAKRPTNKKAIFLMALQALCAYCHCANPNANYNCKAQQPAQPNLQHAPYSTAVSDRAAPPVRLHHATQARPR